jgi:polyhydroxybutyrate depolymerase
MTRRGAGWALAALLAVTMAVAAACTRGGSIEEGCHGGAACRVATAAGDFGRYYVDAPEDWDGRSPLPVIVWFHGYNGSGRAEIGNRNFVRDWTEKGYLFVAADGRGKTWSHQGSPSQARDDIAYVRAVIADVMARYPTDPRRIVAAGFSQGGSMVWSIACFIGAPFTHYAPVSGDFWQPLPSACTAGPITMRHTHGTTDTTFPMQGRAIEGRWRQGDLFRGWDVLRAADGCAADPDHTGLRAADAACMIWSSCADGGLQLCFHRGGHSIPRDWSATTQQWVEWTLAH